MKILFFKTIKEKVLVQNSWLATFFLSFIIMCLVGLVGRQIVTVTATDQFKKDSNQIEESINSSLHRYNDLLVGLHSFILSNNGVNEQQFDKYADSLSLEKQYPALHMIDFTSYETGDSMNDFYKLLKQEYQVGDEKNLKDILDAIEGNESNTQIDIKNGVNEFYIVKYVAPIENTYPYVGLNVAARNESKKELLEAKKTKEIRSTGKIYTSKKANEYPFVSMRMAVLDDKIKNYPIYYGSVGVSIKLDKSLFGALNKNVNYIDFQIFSSEEEGKTLVYDSRFNRTTTEESWPKKLFNYKGEKFIQEHSLKIANRELFIKTFTNKIPPNIFDMNIVFMLMAVVFLLSLLLIHSFIFQRKERKDEFKIAEERYNKLKKQANTDELTGLLNRRAFFIELEERIKHHKVHGNKNIYLLFIDLDGFKRVNDTLGHSAGDMVLKEYASRLVTFAKTMPCYYYRLGGDEFTIFIENDSIKHDLTPQDVENFAKELLNITSVPFYVRGEEFILGQSIGIAEYPVNGVSPEELFKNSDMAMYEAKKKGRNCYMFYSKNFSEEMEKKTQILNLLNSAIDKEEFYCLFQPKVKKENEGSHYTIRGVETLLRWNNPKLGHISPAYFIPLAEEAGLMPQIGNWLINKVAQTMASWKDEKLQEIKVAINVSAKQFNNENLPDYYAGVLRQYGINPERIIIEITESAMMKEPEKTKQILYGFREYGFGVSVDDFGTGHSSLSYLRQFPVTEIKIDKSFVDDILVDEHDRIIVEGIISMSQKLKLDVVLEGVESQEQLTWIEQQEVYGKGIKIQGFLFSKPLSEKDLLVFAQKNR